MENSTLGTKYRIWDRLSLKSVVRPFLMELPLHLFFMKLMGVKAVLALIMQRANALDEIDKYPTYLNLFGRIAILFLFAYIAATIITIIKNKVFKRIFKLLLYFLVVALFFVNAFIQMNFHLGITPTLFILLAETTASESSEFIQQYIFSDTMLPTLKILIISLVEIIVVEVLWSKIKKSRRVYEWIKGVPSYLTKILSIGVLSFLLFGIFSTNIYYRVHKAKSPDFVNGMLPPTDPLSSIYTSWVTLRMMSDNVADAIDINKMAYRTDGTYTTLDDSLNIVVVIGESYIKWHSQLYGYELATAPNMYREQQEGRLFVFNDVISSSKSTSISMRDIFSCNNNSVKEQWYNYPAFSAIFKKAGYNVYFWDNQRDFAKMETYSFTLNSFLYNPELQDIFYTQTNE
ncbi:MAG: sulfatase-like hydrolase/transferase, partial [Bacteroidaceae bacterium]|nr:sulfatase-like hydrolase/transferase [Bacteroidaceae bacterium]